MKVFYRLLANTIIASVTNFTVWFAIVYYAYLSTKSVVATSSISGVFLVTTALSGFWLGSIVDHNKKKTVMLASSCISLLAYLASLAFYVLVPHENFTSIANPALWGLILVIMLGVMSGALRNIALPTIITFLVPADKRDKANGLAGTASGVSFLIVSVISGFLVAHSGMYLVLVLSVFVTILSIVHLLTIPIPEKEIKHKEGKAKKLDIRGTLKVVFSIKGLFALILFTTFNNFLGGVFMSLMDAYGLSLVSVQVWGVLWGVLSCAFIVGGLIIAKRGLGKNPLKSLFTANIIIWTVSIFFTIHPSILLLSIGMFIYLSVVPFIEAAEHTIIQKVVPPERQGRVFGFATSVEQAASPLTAFAIGPLTQYVFIPFMTTGVGAKLIGPWFGVGDNRGIALVFTTAGIIGLATTLAVMRTKPYKLLSRQYAK